MLFVLVQFNSKFALWTPEGSVLFWFCLIQSLFHRLWKVLCVLVPLNSELAQWALECSVSSGST